eukprot:1150104-Pelagomonas_calceolata.AAC.2
MVQERASHVVIDTYLPKPWVSQPWGRPDAFILNEVQDMLVWACDAPPTDVQQELEHIKFMLNHVGPVEKLLP